MWTFNVTRALLQQGGLEVVPKQVPQNDQGMIDAAHEVIQNGPDNTVAVTKSHSRVHPGVPYSRFITPHRDPRDAMVSFMHFMGCDFARGLLAAQEMTGIVDHYRGFLPNIILHLDYSTITDQPREAIATIAQFLGLTPGKKAIAEIENRFQKKKVADLFHQTEIGVEERIERGEKIDQQELTANTDKTVRAFDLETGFQSGHVSDNQPGDWQRILSSEQQAQLQEHLGEWLGKNGYQN
ncbi:MAG: sulfotransferase domain-containing protein [Magnetococcales bacterium]|nr:sulfotransferase domain-containing protein [Magnetococcales bacterium]